MPAATVEATARVMVDEPDPGDAIEAGLKLTVTPVGWPLADRATADPKPFRALVVMVVVPLLPGSTETDEGEAEIVKVEDVKAIMEKGIMTTPALAVDGVVKVAGRVPGKDEIKGFLK